MVWCVKSIGYHRGTSQRKDINYELIRRDWYRDHWKARRLKNSLFIIILLAALTKQQTYRITNYAPASWPRICRDRRAGGGGGQCKKKNKLWFRSNETRQFNWTFPSDAFVITNLSELFHAVNTRFVVLSFFPPSVFRFCSVIKISTIRVTGDTYVQKYFVKRFRCTWAIYRLYLPGLHTKCN